jgi:hypothetical protein
VASEARAPASSRRGRGFSRRKRRDFSVVRFSASSRSRQARGLLVVALGGGLPHVGFDLFGPGLDLALEEGAGLRDARGVFLGRDHVAVLLDLGAGVVVKLPRPVGLGDRVAVGQEDAELLAHLVERAADGLLVGKRAEIPAGVGRAGADNPEAGEGVGEVDADLGNCLSSRKRMFQRGRQRLISLPSRRRASVSESDLMPLHVGHRIHHRGHLGGHPLAGTK